MQSESGERQRWRRIYVDKFLADSGLVFEGLTSSTQKWVMEWARQAKVVEEQPSANFDSVVLQLCKAVESELAAGLGSLQALSFLNSGALGQKAATLRRIKLDDRTKQQLESRGIKPGFVQSHLEPLLSRLAGLRRDSAHGHAEIQAVSLQDANQALELAGKILRGITKR